MQLNTKILPFKKGKYFSRKIRFETININKEIDSDRLDIIKLQNSFYANNIGELSDSILLDNDPIAANTDGEIDLKTYFGDMVEALVYGR